MQRVASLSTTSIDTKGIHLFDLDAQNKKKKKLKYVGNQNRMYLFQKMLVSKILQVHECMNNEEIGRFLRL